ncbi:MAG: hypothetical protein V1754_00350 [Pseudomonadota bacterium]
MLTDSDSQKDTPQKQPMKKRNAFVFGGLVILVVVGALLFISTNRDQHVGQYSELRETTLKKRQIQKVRERVISLTRTIQDFSQTLTKLKNSEKASPQEAKLLEKQLADLENQLTQAEASLAQIRK